MRAIRHRLEEITKDRYVPVRSPSLKRVYLKMDVDRIRDLGIRVDAEPAAWVRAHRYNQAGDRFAINCIAYALGLYHSKIFIETMKSDLRAWRTPRDASTGFAEALLDRFQTRQKKAQPRPGDLVVYCDNHSRVKHMGIVLCATVRSKWDTSQQSWNTAYGKCR